MRYKELGKTGLRVSEISLGTWGIGGAGWGNTDYGECEKAVRSMLEQGVNLIDTAPAYNDGEAERFIGKLLSKEREKLCLVTKTGTSYKNGKYCRDNSAEAIKKQCDESLQNLKTDYIDVYLVHWPDKHISAEETFSELNRLKAAGKIKHIGVSNFSWEEIEEAAKYAEIEVIQDQYSMVFRDHEEKLKRAHETGLGVMTYGSMGAGILSGKYKERPAFGAGDMRTGFYHFFEEPQFSRIQALINKMEALAKGKKNCSISQIALNWSIQKPFVDTAIVGVRTADHAVENCSATEWKLTEDELRSLEAEFV